MSQHLIEPPGGVTDEDRADSLQQALPGRYCGACNLCCKVFIIEELQKPAGELCQHAMIGEGCAIHAERPVTCRKFFCGWRVDPSLGPDWKPDVSGLVIWIARHYAALMVTVDPNRPLAWTQSPYYGFLKNLSGHYFPQGKHVLVMNGAKATIVLPDKDQPLGALGPGDKIVVTRNGRNFTAEVLKPAG